MGHRGGKANAGYTANKAITYTVEPAQGKARATEASSPVSKSRLSRKRTDEQRCAQKEDNLRRGAGLREISCLVCMGGVSGWSARQYYITERTTQQEDSPTH